jgi:hypothetical protein
MFMDAFEKLCGMPRAQIYEADFNSYRTPEQKDSYISSIYGSIGNGFIEIERRWKTLRSTIESIL